MPGNENYDYNQLAEKPKVWGFFIGWFGQSLFTLVHLLRSSVPGDETRQLWEAGQARVLLWS